MSFGPSGGTGTGLEFEAGLALYSRVEPTPTNVRIGSKAANGTYGRFGWNEAIRRWDWQKGLELVLQG